MSILSSFFVLLFYLSLLVFFVGLFFKVKQYAKTEQPLKIPVAPAPLTKSKVYFRMFREVIFFESLFKSSKWTWIFSWLFHFGLLLVLIRHIRYFYPGDIPEVLLLTQPFKYAAFAMLVGVLGLLIRRITVERVRYISSPSDYLLLILLIIIVISGSVMTFTTNHTNIMMVKDFASGLITFNFSSMPSEINFIIHLLFVFILILIFPFSKLLHAPGIFFSPTRNQVDDSRKNRHISNWALVQETNKEIVLGETLGTNITDVKKDK